MPVGIIINTTSVLLGGLAGTLLGNKLSSDFKSSLNLIFGVCSMTMGIGSIIHMENMPAVVFSAIIGTVIGLALHLGNLLNSGARNLQKSFFSAASGKSESTDELVTAIVLFCASGTGIYGAIISGMSGDHSVLIAKSVLDFFTAMIFACSLGTIVSAIAVPQCIIFLLLFLLSHQIFPLTNASMINDFKAVGGMLLLATGFRMAKIKLFPIADMIPAMILAMPVSWIWSTFVVPLVS